MKKCILFLIYFCISSFGFTQTDNKKDPAIGVHFIFDDFRNFNGVKTGNTYGGLSASYLTGINNHIDFVITASGSFPDYPIPNKPPFSKNNFLLELSSVTNVKLITDRYWFSPYLTIGLGFSKYLNYYGMFIPAGLGLQFNFNNNTYLLLDAQYRLRVTENTNNHFYYSVGLAGNIWKKKKTILKKIPTPLLSLASKDSDGDGLPDDKDKCPTVPGFAKYQGCPVPDSDGDGVNDENDKCPNVTGVAKYYGCPIPDTDGDGINDEEDKCPQVPGLAKYHGCPVPDSDSDGVNDENDKCPHERGLVNNAGCPIISNSIIDKINTDARNIFFKTGSSELETTSYEALDDIAKTMIADTSLKLEIGGHTDSIGTPAKNKILSEDRANAVKDYLKAKGILEYRMSATGFGQEKPVADNKTIEGRAKNRRVEMRVRNYW